MNEYDPWLKKRGILNNTFQFNENCLFQEFSIDSNIEAVGLVAFDIIRNQYVSVWNENLGTGFMIGYGNWHHDYDILDELGSFSHPIKKKIVQFISITEFINEYCYIKRVYLPITETSFYEAAILKYNKVTY